MDILEADGEIAQICVVLGLSAEISALGCDITAVLDIKSEAIAS